MTEPVETRFEIRTADWLGVGEAQARILGHATPLPTERVALLDALGRALAEGEVARATLPPWDNSAMDGYAVYGDDVAGASPGRPIRLTVAGRVHAGDPPPPPPERGQAVRIMTGAPVPPGLDTVVRVEDTDAEAEPGIVHVLKDRDRGRHVRPSGQDVEAGAAALPAGWPVHAGTIAMLAALGTSEVMVHARPRVAILGTGNELREPERYDEVIAGAGIPESNGPTLCAAVLEAGAVPHLLGVAPDREDAILAGLERGRGADALVTVGGASMGEADLVKRALDRRGFRLDFWRVRMRPGTPFSFGLLPRGEASPQPVFGLPGNPASAFVTFELFVRPFLLRLAGHHDVFRLKLTVVAGADIHGSPDRTMYVRVGLDTTADPPRVVPSGPQGSGLVRSLPGAEALAVVPEGREVVREGETLEALVLRLPPSSLPG